MRAEVFQPSYTPSRIARGSSSNSARTHRITRGKAFDQIRINRPSRAAVAESVELSRKSAVNDRSPNVSCITQTNPEYVSHHAWRVQNTRSILCEESPNHVRKYWASPQAIIEYPAHFARKLPKHFAHHERKIRHHIQKCNIEFCPSRRSSGESTHSTKTIDAAWSSRPNLTRRLPSCGSHKDSVNIMHENQISHDLRA